MQKKKLHWFSTLYRVSPAMTEDEALPLIREMMRNGMATGDGKTRLETGGKVRKELAAERDRLREVNAELLAALKGFVSSLTGGGKNNPRVITVNHDELRMGIDRARAAIAKAEGRS